MQSSLFKSKEKIRSKLRRKMATLEKKFASNPEITDSKMLDEANKIQDLLELLAEESITSTKFKDKVSVKDNLEESWYRKIAGYWLDQHPDAGINPNQQSTIYKFALHFFVEQVVMNPDNTALSYASLLRKMEYLNSEEEQLQNINRSLEDLKELTSFVAAMQHEHNTLPEGMRQMKPATFENLKSEIEASGPFGIAFTQYEKNRLQDKINAKKRGDGGIEF